MVYPGSASSGFTLLQNTELLQENIEVLKELFFFLFLSLGSRDLIYCTENRSVLVRISVFTSVIVEKGSIRLKLIC